MAGNYIPRRDGAFRTWAKSFTQNVSSQAEALGVPAAMAAELVEANDRFAQAYATVCRPLTRSPVNVERKNLARRGLEELIRRIVHLVRAMGRADDEMLIGLGLSPRRAKRRRVPAPVESPFVSVWPGSGNSLHVKLRGVHASGRGGKPTDVAGAMVYTFVGEDPPTDRSRWQGACTTTRPRCGVTFPMGLRPGTKVWVTACWLSPTAEPGPMSEPVYGYLMGGLRFDELRLAA